MNFLVEDKLNQAIFEILKTPNPRCAVAFWGNGSQKLFKGTNLAQIKIICNLKMGGTNPEVIRDLKKRNADVRQHNLLHAKVYLSDDVAVIASANASTNGLGLEGRGEPWVEAGVLTRKIERVSAWFEALWTKSKEITEQDLDDAQRVWDQRPETNREIVTGSVARTFGDLSATEIKNLLVTWEGSSDYEANIGVVEEHLGRPYDEETELLVDDGIDVEGDEDIDALRPGTWVLFWSKLAQKKGLPKQTMGLRLVCTGEIVKGAVRYKGEGYDRNVAFPVRIPPLFNVKEKAFEEAFRDVISRDAYLELRTDDYEGAWFTKKRTALMRRFWGDLRKKYGSL